MQDNARRRLKRSERARQMREAQRRRRERLRSEKQRFLQVILSENIRERLYIHAIAHEQTLQEYVLGLIKRGLERAEAEAFQVRSADFTSSEPEVQPANIVPMEPAVSAESIQQDDDMSTGAGQRSDASPHTGESTVVHPFSPVPSLESVPQIETPLPDQHADDKSSGAAPEPAAKKKKSTPQLELF